MEIHCERRALTCSSVACVQDWQRAQFCKPSPWESRWHCRNCLDGAQRAGHSLRQAAALTQLDAISHVCSRCRKQSTRLVKHFCLSCYNRDLELRKGRNGKGTTPTVLRKRYPLFGQWALRTHTAFGWQWGQLVDRAAVDAVEALIVLARQHHAPLLFARSVPICSAAWQRSFWGGL